MEIRFDTHRGGRPGGRQGRWWREVEVGRERKSNRDRQRGKEGGRKRQEGMKGRKSGNEKSSGARDYVFSKTHTHT